MAEQSKSWQWIDLTIKVAYPLVVSVLGWVAMTTFNHSNRLTAIEANRVTERDVTELERRWQTKLESIHTLLYSIDSKLSELKGRLEPKTPGM